MKLWGKVGRGQGVTSLRFAYPLPLPPPHHSVLSSSTRSASQHPPLPGLPSATDRKSKTSSYPCSSCFASSFLLHKITEAVERKRSGRCVA